MQAMEVYNKSMLSSVYKIPEKKKKRQKTKYYRSIKRFHTQHPPMDCREISELLLGPVSRTGSPPDESHIKSSFTSVQNTSH